MAINIIDPNLKSYLNTILGSVGTGQSTNSSGSDFYAVLSALTSGADSAAANTAAGQAATQTTAQSVNLDDIFQKASDTYGVSTQLLKAVAKAESNFNPTAESSSGAKGIMQLMPGTAKSLGVTDVFDPEQNIMGGAKYLSQMISQVHGNVEVGLAAYNAGPGAVQKYHGIPPYKETQNYIAKVMDYCNDNLVAGTTSVSGASGTADAVNAVNAAGSATDPLAGISAKDLSTMMSLYRYQTELSALAINTDSDDDSKSGTDLFSTSLTNYL
jgi:hypothetical protein